jgi:PAS domain S-box-containing protein
MPVSTGGQATSPAESRRGERRPPVSGATQQAVLTRAALWAPWPLAVTDAAGNILAANEAAASLLGYSRSEFQTLHILDTCPHDRDSAASEALEELARTGVLSGVGPARRRDGAHVIVRYAGRKLEVEGHVLYVFCSFPVRVIDNSSTPQARGGTSPRQAKISEREREILLLVGDGYENDQIARRLHLSVNTVKTYMQRALMKLGAHSRAHAIALAIRRGLID